MPRQARLDSPGTMHHVIIRGINKRRIIDDEADSKDFVRRLGLVAEETQTVIYAWALMSNHAHLLVCSGPVGLAKFMRRLLTGYAISYNRRHRRYGYLFQNRYKSMVCDGDRYFTVEDYGVTMAEVSRQIGISISRASKLVSRSLST